jgi:multiple sugar transport system substrate-binding protein
VRDIVQVLKTLYEEGLTSRGMEYGVALQGFAAGEGGIMANGTWTIGDLLKQARQPDSATYNGFTARHSHSCTQPARCGPTVTFW